MKKLRWLLILNSLSETDFITGEDLAKRLDLSSKTIHRELKNLKNVLENEGAHIISKTKHGYSLRIEDEAKYQYFVNSLRKADSIPETPQDRIHYLLEMLLIKTDYVKLDDLCSQIYISRSGLTNCLKEVRKLLEEYDLKLINRPRHGIKVEGDEFNLRLCIASTMVQKLELENKFKGGALEKIAECIQSVLKGSNIKISEVATQNLLVHIYIVIERIKNKCYLEISNDQISVIEKESEYSYALRIADLLSQVFQLQIPKSEIGYIAIHLASKRIIEDATINNGFVINQEIYDMVTHMLDEIQNSYNIDLHDDLELRMVLAMHLIPFEIRIKYNLNLKNPLLKEIKTSYTLAYMIAISACEVLNRYYHKIIKEDEIGYLALHFNLALERINKEVNKKNILVVCSTGRGTAQILLWQIKEEFHRYVNKIDICEAAQISSMNLSDVDYIFTTVQLPITVNKPVLYIQLFLNAKDRNAIHTVLNKNYTSSLSRFFDSRLFFPHLKASNKIEIIEQMVSKIAEFIELPQNFSDLVYEREKMGVTAFGNLVAIPHPNKAIVNETFVSVAILNKPIQWDGRRVQFVLMFALKKNNKEDMMYFSRVIAKMLFNKKHINEMIHNPYYSKLIEIISLIEKEINEENG